MTNRHERRKAAKTGQMQRKVHQPSAIIDPADPRVAIEKMIVFGENSILADTNVQQFADLLSYVVSRIHDPYIFSGSLSEKWQPSQLKAYFKALGDFEGMQLNEQITILIENLTGSIEEAKAFYKQAHNTYRKTDPLYVGEMRLMHWATELQKGLTNLLDNADNGEALKTAIETFEGDFMKKRREAQSAARPKRAGVQSDPVFNQDILDAIKHKTKRDAMKTLKSKYPDRIGDPYDANDFEAFKSQVTRARDWKEKLGGTN